VLSDDSDGDGVCSQFTRPLMILSQTIVYSSVTPRALDGF